MHIKGSRPFINQQYFGPDSRLCELKMTYSGNNSPPLLVYPQGFCHLSSMLKENLFKLKQCYKELHRVANNVKCAFSATTLKVEQNYFESNLVIHRIDTKRFHVCRMFMHTECEPDAHIMQMGATLFRNVDINIIPTMLRSRDPPEPCLCKRDFVIVTVSSGLSTHTPLPV